MDIELRIDFLRVLHGIDISPIYVERMSCFACSQQGARSSGLWCDVLSIKWLETWPFIPICVW